MPQDVLLVVEAGPANECPVCGGPNECAMARNPDGAASPDGDAGAPCWCVAERFPSELLETLPESERGARCLCVGCLEAHRKAPA